MRYRNLFALGVRLFGIWLITRGFYSVAIFADAKIYSVTGPARDNAAGSLIYATLDFALAAFFLLWTQAIVDWTYHKKSGTDKDPEIGTERQSDDDRKVGDM
jgi:hypothetical protein